MRFGSLFSGVGGFDLGFERAGMECAWQVEINEQCQRVLEARWPDVQRHDDVTTFNATIAVRPDVICGGFPCQDLSVAGKRAGLDGERSGLWFEFQRVIAEFSPTWVCIENVPGLLSSWSGDTPSSLGLAPGPRRTVDLVETSDFSVVTNGLAKLGYGWAMRVLDAQWFGVAQRRRRVFIVGCVGDCRRAAEVLFESDCLPWDSPPSREAGTRPSKTISGSAHPGGHNGQDDDNVIVHTLRAEGFDASEDGTGRGTPLVPAFAIQERAVSENPNAGPQGKGWQEGIGYTLEARHHQQAVAFAQNQRDELRTMEVAGALAAEPGMKQQTYAMQTMGVRRLMPIECERLQGFPDNWTIGSDSARYRMLGNAVCVPVAEWIARRLIAEGEEPFTKGGWR